jgi:hypothetical protein
MSQCRVHAHIRQHFRLLEILLFIPNTGKYIGKMYIKYTLLLRFSVIEQITSTNLRSIIMSKIYADNLLTSFAAQSDSSNRSALYIRLIIHLDVLGMAFEEGNGLKDIIASFFLDFKIQVNVETWKQMHGAGRMSSTKVFGALKT